MTTILPACDLCYAKKTRCDRQDPCGHCVAAKAACLRHRPRQVSRNRDRLDAVLERISNLEDSLRRPSISSQRGETPSARRSSIARSTLSDVTSQASDIGSDTNAGTSATAISLQNDQEELWTLHERQNPQARPRFQDHSLQPLPTSRKRPSESPADESSGRDVTRRRESSLAEKVQDEEGHSPQDKALASLDLSRYLRLGPYKNREVDVDRQPILESAIAIAKKVQTMSSEPNVLQMDSKTTTHNFYGPSAYPTAEFLHLLARENARNNPSQYFVSLFSSLDRVPLLERMAFSLINNTVHGQDRIRSLVCANHVAYSFLTGLQSDKSPEMQRELARSKMGYQNNILDALKNLDVTVQPDVMLLYALHSGAMLMQDMGYMRQCWKLNAAACRVGSALKGRSAAELGLQHPEDIVGMKTVCIKSFIYDMAMSANVYQPPCMATMELDRSVLDTTSPCDAMLSVMLTFAEVQEAIVHETRKCVSPGQTHQIDTDKLGALERKMQGVRAQVEEFRARPESSSDDYLRFEWLSIDLNFYSMMTTITRLGSVGDDPHAHMKCLENARRCLFTLKAMLAQFAQVTSPDRYLSSLAWIVPLFPLRPLYFVFRNAIETSDAFDLKILQDVANSLEAPAKSLESVLQIQRLCHSFVNLFQEYAEKAMYSPDYQLRRLEQHTARAQNDVQDSFQQPEYHRHNPVLSGLPSSSIQPFSYCYQTQFGIDPSLPSGKDAMLCPIPPPIDAALFDQQVDWELFCAQPPLNLY